MSTHDLPSFLGLEVALAARKTRYWVPMTVYLVVPSLSHHEIVSAFILPSFLSFENGVGYEKPSCTELHRVSWNRLGAFRSGELGDKALDSPVDRVTFEAFFFNIIKF